MIQKVYALPDLIFTKYHCIFLELPGVYWWKAPGLIHLKYFVLTRETQWKHIHNTPRSSRMLMFPAKLPYLGFLLETFPRFF